MNKPITVFVNDKPKKLHPGLHVKNAIGPKRSRAVREHRLIVKDQDGNPVDVDGALYEGERLYLTKTDPQAYSRLLSG